MNRDSRRQQMIKLASAAAFLAIVAVAVLIVVTQSESEGGDSSDIVGAAEVREQLQGIPQQGMLLGEPGAKTILIEFADLQCPVCKGYAEEVLPTVIENQVRSGEAKIDFRNFTIIGEESADAGAAALAAGEQGKGWEFVEIFFHNQGGENAGYITDQFLTAVARAAGVPDIDKWNSQRRSQRIRNQVVASGEEAERLGFSGTPSFAVRGPGSAEAEAIGTPGSSSALESAISDAS